MSSQVYLVGRCPYPVFDTRTERAYADEIFGVYTSLELAQQAVQYAVNTTAGGLLHPRAWQEEGTGIWINWDSGTNERYTIRCLNVTDHLHHAGVQAGS